MIIAQASRFLWIGLTFGLAGCVSQSGARNALCSDEAIPTSYMSSGALWDLSADAANGGRLPGSLERLQQRSGFSSIKMRAASPVG